MLNFLPVKHHLISIVTKSPQFDKLVLGCRVEWRHTFRITTSLKYLSASFQVGPSWTTSCAPAAFNFAIIIGFVDSGTTTVQGSPSVRDAWTAARPALPPLEEKMCGLLPLGVMGGSSATRAWMKFPIPLIYVSIEHRLKWDTGLPYRDLKEPEGCKFSSLRKILLLRFRTAYSHQAIKR